MSPWLVQNVFHEIMEERCLEMDGESLDPFIHSYEDDGDELTVRFKDERVGYFIAGYVACSIHEDVEERLAALNFKIKDIDGRIMTLERIK